MDSAIANCSLTSEHTETALRPHSLILSGIVYATNCLEHILTLSCLHRSNLFKIYVIQQGSKNRLPTDANTRGINLCHLRRECACCRLEKCAAPNSLHPTSEHMERNTSSHVQTRPWRTLARFNLPNGDKMLLAMACLCLLVATRFNSLLIMKYSGLVTSGVRPTTGTHRAVASSELSPLASVCPGGTE